MLSRKSHERKKKRKTNKYWGRRKTVGDKGFCLKLRLFMCVCVFIYIYNHSIIFIDIQNPHKVYIYGSWDYAY